MQGWISLHRQLKEHWLWQDNRPFDRRSAWIDLLLSANHKDAKVPLGNELIEVERGSFITSIRQLCDKWKWSNTKVIAFLELLENDGMILYKSDKKKTVITIVKYSDYQDLNDTKTTNKRHTNDTQTTQKHTNNNDNNENNDNKKEYIPAKKQYAQYVKMTEEEYQKLIDDYGEQKTKDMIEDLNNYKGSKGKKYKSDYLTIRSWIRKEQKEQKDKPKPKNRFHNFEQPYRQMSNEELKAILNKHKDA
jgi:DNA-binding transcriptional MocR family regulator